MLGLFGTLDLASRSLQTQRLGIEIAGQNIANVNNPAYARQRLELATAVCIPTTLGPQGTGVDAVAITQLRSGLLDRQIQNETSVSGYLETWQSALQLAEAGLGQTINRQGAASGVAGASGQNGIGDALNDFFNGLQSLSADPASPAERQVLLARAADLASRFNVTDQRLAGLQTQLNQSLEEGVRQANDLLAQVAALNEQISRAELGAPGAANDLRDLRQSKIESLAKLANLEVAANPNGSVDIAIGGATLVSGFRVAEQLEIYDAGSGQWLVRARNSGAAPTLTGGSLAGAIEARDGEVASLRQGLDQLAAHLITEVNAIHRAGYDLAGNTGADFFTGAGAADIRVNPALANNPSRVQAAGVSGAAGDNQIALQLAQLATRPAPGMDGQTFSQNYGRLVAALGQGLASANARIADQNSVRSLLAGQRDSLSGVSLDEEMTSMMKYQSAYQASARLITVVNDLFEALINAQR